MPQPVNMVGPRLLFRERIKPYVMVRVTVGQIGGSNGNANGSASWTYDCYWPWDSGNEHKLNVDPLAPERPRGNGTFTAGTMGVGYFNDAGDFVLAEVEKLKATEMPEIFEPLD